MNNHWVATLEELQEYLRWVWSQHPALLTRTPA